MVQKYFDKKVLKYEEIKGHFNINYKVTTSEGIFHLKILKNNKFEIKAWIAGVTVQEWNDEEVMKLCKTLRQFHSLKLDLPKMDFKLEKITDKKYHELVNLYLGKGYVPCHNDINKDNVVVNEKGIALIDFEFQRMNNFHWDVANIINEDKLNEKHIEMFLKYYPSLSKKTLNDFIYINKVFNKYWKNKFL